MPAIRILILTALLPEARAIARAFHLPARFPAHQTIAPPDADGSPPLAVAIIGLRARQLPQAVANLQPQAIIMAGVAGALSPELRIGDLVAQGPFSQDLPGLPSPYRLFRGTLHTSSSLLATPAAKAALFQQTGALAVDMETQHAQDFAAKLSIPFLALRAISDAAQDPLDPALLNLIDAQGRPRIAHAIAHLCRHPNRLPALLHIQRATTRALSHLTACLVPLVRSGWPHSPTKRPDASSKN